MVKKLETVFRKITTEAIDKIEKQLPSAFDLSFVLNRFTLGDEFLKIGSVKLFADGSGGARTAWVWRDWNKNRTGIDEGNSGYPAIDAILLGVSVAAISAIGPVFNNLVVIVTLLGFYVPFRESEGHLLAPSLAHAATAVSYRPRSSRITKRISSSKRSRGSAPAVTMVSRTGWR